jgi:hypothetical protein
MVGLMDMASGESVITADDEWAFVRWRNLLIVVWRRTPSHERARLLGAQIRSIAAEKDRPVLQLVAVVERDVHAPDAEARGAIQNDLRALGSQVGSLSALVLAEGFVGAAVRASMTGMSLFLRQRYPVGVHRTVADTGAWVAARMGGGVAEAEVAAVIDRARRA